MRDIASCCLCSFVVRRRRGPKVRKDQNGRKQSRPVPPVFLYLFRQFLYLRKNTEMEREAGGGVSRPYLRDPVFNRDNSVFFPYL